ERRNAHPGARLAAVVEHDPLAEPEAEAIGEEFLVERHVPGEDVQVVDPPYRDAGERSALRAAEQRAPLVCGNVGVVDLPEDLHGVPVGRGEPIGGAVAAGAADPAAAVATLPERVAP